MISMSEKLLLDDLKLLCEESLVGEVSVENILEILVHTHNVQSSTLLKKEL